MEENVTQNVAEPVNNGITLMDLWVILAKYFWRILLLAVIFTLIEAGVTKFLVKTSYSATASIIMNPGLIEEDDGSATDSAAADVTYSAVQQKYNYYQLCVRLLSSISPFIKNSQRVSDDVTAKAADQVANPDVEQLKNGNISVSTQADQLQIFITYSTTTSPEAARATVIALANSVCEMSKAKENGQYLYLWANTLHVDDLPKKVTSTNRWLLFVAVAFALFFVLFYLYYLIVSITDDTVKGKREIEDLTGFNVMAYVSDIDTEKVRRAKRQRNGTADGAAASDVS